MIESVFSSLRAYFLNVIRGVGSVVGSCFTILPYFIRIGAGDLQKEVTEQFPDPISSRMPDDMPPRFRGLLHNEIERCTGCGECDRVCPARCITIKCDEGPEITKLWVVDFRIDFSSCIFCGLCVEACQPGSLTHTKEYRAAALSKEALVKEFGRGPVTPNQRSKWADAIHGKESGGLQPW